MFEGAGDYLAKKAQQLGLERADVLRKVQAELDQLYPNQTRAVSFNNGVLSVTTANASVASELRFKSQWLKQVAGAVSVRISIKSITD